MESVDYMQNWQQANRWQGRVSLVNFVLNQLELELELYFIVLCRIFVLDSKTNNHTQ